MNAPPMTFEGPAFVGGPNVTLQGTAKDVYEQLRELNPNYDASEFPEYRERAAAAEIALAARGLEKRDWV